MLVVLDHWYEMKIRLFYLIISFFFTFAVSYFYSEVLMYFYVAPFVSKFEDKRFIFTSLSEGFSSYLLVSLNASMLLTFVLVVYSINSFLICGLYKKEYFILKSIFVLSSLSLTFSFLLYNAFILPSIIFFFGHFEDSKLFELSLEAKISDYLKLVLSWFFWISFILQLPVIIFFLIRFNKTKVSFFVTRRKESFILIFVLGALFSPPDVLTQLLIVFPLLLLLEVSIFLYMIIEEYGSKTKESCSSGKRWVC